MEERTFDELIDDLESVPTWAKEAERAAVTDAQLTDLAGTLNSLASSLGGIKRGILVEVPPGIEGKRWAFTQGKTATRSYNTTAILLALVRETGWDLMTVIKSLLSNKVIEIKWKWTPLKQYLSRHDIPLVTVGHEVQDGDVGRNDEPAPMVGELWGDASPKWEAVQTDEYEESK